MGVDRLPDALTFISSQLDAASSLLKYAADDLHELIERGTMPLATDIATIAGNLNAQATAVAGSSAFFTRLAEECQMSSASPIQQAFTMAPARRR